MKIKLSNKILLIAGAVPILFIILMLSAFKFFSSGEVNSQGSSTGVPNQITRALPLEGFSEISVTGVWKVNIFQGKNFLVNISATESDLDKIRAEKNGNELVLDIKEEFKHSKDYERITADITLPDLSRINIMNGVATINLSGLDIDSLSVKTLGVANISGDKGSIRDLEFDNQGVLRTDLSAIQVTNANIMCNGVFTIELLMNGGRLSGNLNGIGSLNYHGDVSENDIRVNGPFSKVVHQNR